MIIATNANAIVAVMIQVMVPQDAEATDFGLETGWRLLATASDTGQLQTQKLVAVLVSLAALEYRL